MVKFCTSCGKQLPLENTEICPNCGVLINPQPKLKPKKSEGSGAAKLLIIGVVLLIGLVIAAMVFYYIALGAGYFTSGHADGPSVVTTPKNQETVYKGVEQATANIQMIGNVYGLASNPSEGIDEIKFSTGLTPGAASVDLRRMTIVFSTVDSGPFTYTQGSTASTKTFTSTLPGGDSVNLLNANDQVQIDFKIAGVKPNTRMNIEIRPNTGASLPITRTAPAMISTVNILY
jgi:archaeal flagellin FlaB